MTPPAARGVPPLLVLALALTSLLAIGCIKQKDSLVVVAVTSAIDLPAAARVTITVADVTRTFSLPTGLSATAPEYLGVYVEHDVTGTITVRATSEVGVPCIRYAATDTSVHIGSAGDTVSVTLRLVAGDSCSATDAGTGIGQPPSLATCREFVHSAVDDCTGLNDATLFSVAISPNGQLVVSAGDDGRAKVWRFDGRALVAEGHVLSGVGFGIAAFSPDGTMLAVGWSTGIDLWSVSTWTRLRVLTTANTVYDLGFTPDGQQVISIDATTLYAHAIDTPPRCTRWRCPRAPGRWPCRRRPRPRRPWRSRPRSGPYGFTPTARPDSWPAPPPSRSAPTPARP